jgi:hypothetical protein
MPAVALLMDRLEGKALQQMEIGEPGQFRTQDEIIGRTVELQAKLFNDESFMAQMREAVERAEDAVEVPLLPTRVK